MEEFACNYPFEVVLLERAAEFVAALPADAQEKVQKVLTVARKVENLKLFKPLREDVWEFRIQHLGDHYRLFAFWVDPEAPLPTVVCTHGWHKRVKKCLQSS